MTAAQFKGKLKIIHVVKNWANYLLDFTISLEILNKKFFNPRSSLQRRLIEIFELLREKEKRKENPFRKSCATVP
jgi:hypothetical protein